MPTIDDFTLLSVIGVGTYAKVLLVRHKETDRVFAMKVLKKKHIAEQHQEKHILTQKEVLASLEHPFLMKLYYAFQDPKKLYFVLEYCPGGELFRLLQIKNTLSEQHTRFYVSQIVLALEALHSRNIIYRDLKPQNVLIDRTGYIKLTDFGLSKILENNELAESVCGTPEYLAPEIICKEGHGKPVDWWCLGCLIFEMVAGTPPFYSENRHQLFESIRSCDPKFPETFSPHLKGLLRGLLQKNPKKRLGSKGGQDIKKHPWFQPVNWDSYLHKKYKAPYTPTIKSQEDTSHFDEEFTSEKVDSLKEKNLATEHEEYAGFSFEDKK